MNVELFPQQQVVGAFRGFRESGMEFRADLVLPYRTDFQARPMHGQFVLVQLETQDEAILGRIASFASEGKLADGPGEEFSLRAISEHRDIPEDLRQEFLKYRVNVRILGVLRRENDQLQFVASHRRLPHVGSPVAFPSDEVLRWLVGHYDKGAEIGYYALGEYIYAGSSDQLERLGWMQIKDPEITVRFPVDALVARRSFVFARAGYGKSNLTKLMFSTLYRTTPMVTKRGGRQVPVGTVIFDPEGEYFWPDDQGRPGLADVPALEDKLVVFTPKSGPSPFYQSFVAADIKLDIRQLKPADVISIALPPDRQDQQNVIKLRNLSDTRWEQLVNLIADAGNEAGTDAIAGLLNLDPGRQDMEAIAARSNMTAIVKQLHDPSSLMLDRLLEALRQGKLCVVDVSQMRGTQATILSGLILRKIFEHNQLQFTRAQPETIPTIAVIEEAQVVLNAKTGAAEPYIAWVKEGRKYDLGSLMITQQPGSIPFDILSQGDNWFIFHLLSTGDLMDIKNANAHFSIDLLSGILNEPIKGQGVFWSSATDKPYPIALRVLSFERMYPVLDPDSTHQAADTWAVQTQQRYERIIGRPARIGPVTSTASEQRPAVVQQTADGELIATAELAEETVDVMATLETQAIDALRTNGQILQHIHSDGRPWRTVQELLLGRLPMELANREDIAYRLVPKAMDQVVGEAQNKGWHTFKHPDTGKTWVKAGAKPQ